MNRTRSIQNKLVHAAAGNMCCPDNSKCGPGTGRGAGLASLTLQALSASLLLALAMQAHATEPTGGVVIAGQAGISSSGPTTTITQSSPNAIINWQSFSIGAGNTVQFMQPGRTSVALNRVLGADPSIILGNLTANGNVFLVNPNGVLFGNGAVVSVGGLVASTMGITNADFMAGHYAFANAGGGSILNQGRIVATTGGYVALMGRSVSNQGVISARLGSVALASGEAATLDVAGDGLLNVAVSKGAVNALASNGGLIQADGGRVLLTAQAAGNLLNTVVNNTGTIQAQTIQNHNGTILLLGDMESGTVNVGGRLDASAPGSGNGGLVETSASRVNIRNGAHVSTSAAQGQIGQWRIDPLDFTVGSAPGDNISGATLSNELVTNNITIDTTAPAGTGNGDIFINDAVSWTASGTPTTLTLNANRDVNINAAVTATNGNFSVCCGRDVNVKGAITTTNGSVKLSAGNDVNQRAAITVTDGNLLMCAANNVNVFSALTLTRGTADPTRSLGLPLGMTLSADSDGTGPGIAGGTVVFDSLAPLATVTAAPVNIFYNPVSYAAPTDYSNKFTLTEGATLTQYMLVFAAGGDKTFDGTTATTLTGLKGSPTGVTLVNGPGSSANFDSSAVGVNKGITYSGYTLGGPNAGAYAFAFNCCGPVFAHTTGSIAAAPPPPTTPPPTTPPPTTPPPTTPPPTTPPPTLVVGPPVLGIPPPPLLLWTPPPTTLVEVTPSSPPTVAMVEVPVAIQKIVPYVAPLYKPKPDRN
ncbi:MAG TPA: filamentous hemagglutinin N-terminal domain-containing protein [Rhodanobacteraceae bacterium]|nr:filamentous hemagglutinin N-terminal domain-containing protein [Rhodanobacteraceae bacterium]